MVDLALHQSEGPVNLNQIAERQQVSRRYLEQIMLQLAANGFVRPIRGRSGGFVLLRAASEISVGDVLVALEGPVRIVDCVGDPGICTRSPSCAIHDVWCEISDVVTRHFAGISLEELSHRQLIKEEAQLATYNI